MKKVLIIFSDIHLPYSPTVLNLFYELKKHCEVTLFCPEPEDWFSVQKVEDPGIVYFKPEVSLAPNPGLFARVINKITNRFSPPPTSESLLLQSLSTPKTEKLIEVIEEFDGEIIAVDFLSLWCTQQAGKKAHFLSLEINENDRYRDACDLSLIKSVLIQSIERFKKLFKDLEPNYFIVQNAPHYINFLPNYKIRKQTDLIFCGSATLEFGIVTCLEFLKDYPEYRLTINGAMPKASLTVINSFFKDLIYEKRLIINDKYLDPTSLTHYVSQFRIGLAFYDFYRFEHIRSFNYFTAPSGKVFQYLNSGVPVIGNNLPGFHFIHQKKTGALISHLSSLAIKSAIDTIESEYDEIAKNAKDASFDFDFSKNVSQFIDFLICNE